MNKFCIIGNVTKDAELRATSTGVQVCSFSVAVNSRRRTSNDGSNQQQEDTMYVRVSLWRERGVALAPYLKKGTKVYVEGPLQQPRMYTAQDGTQRVEIQMTCSELELCGSRGDGSSYQPASSQPAAPTAAKENNGFQTANDADLPF